MINGVHIPLTFQPTDPSISMSATLVREIRLKIHNMVAGDRRYSANLEQARRYLSPDSSLSASKEREGPVKGSGMQARPTKSESEKFRVAKVAKNIPRSRWERHWVKSWC